VAKVKKGAGVTLRRSGKARKAGKATGVKRAAAQRPSGKGKTAKGKRAAATKAKRAKPKLSKAQLAKARASQLAAARAAKAAAAAAAVRFDVRPLDPRKKCGPGTSVQLLYRVDERTVERGSTTHLVFFDRHGWYCEHGRTCPAVVYAKQYNGHIARAS
jgi:hypothetical protein